MKLQVVCESEDLLPGFRNELDANADVKFTPSVPWSHKNQLHGRNIQNQRTYPVSVTSKGGLSTSTLDDQIFSPKLEYLDTFSWVRTSIWGLVCVVQSECDTLNEIAQVVGATNGVHFVPKNT